MFFFSILYCFLQVWHVADVPKNDKFQYTHFAHKINSFDTAPSKLLASDSRLRPDRYSLEQGDLSKAGCEKHRFFFFTHFLLACLSQSSSPLFRGVFFYSQPWGETKGRKEDTRNKGTDVHTKMVRSNGWDHIYSVGRYWNIPIQREVLGTPRCCSELERWCLQWCGPQIDRV